MAINIFSMIGEIIIDATEAEISMQKIKNRAEQLADKIGAGLKAVGNVASAVGGAAKVAGEAVFSLSKDTAAVGDNIDKMSQKIGISREAYQELDFITSQSGTSVDNLKAGLKTLTSVMDKTKEGTSKTKTALEELGVSAVDSNGNFRDNEEVMWECFEALTKMEDQTAKERLAVELFGKAGSELMPMLNGSADSIQNMRQQAHDLGLVMSDEAVDASVKFTDTMDQLQRSFSAAKNNLGAALLPIVQKFAAKLLEYMPKIQSFINRIIPVVERLAESVIDPLMEMIDELFPPLMDFVESLIEPVTDIISAVLPVLIDLLKKALPIITDIIKELLPPLLDILDDLMPLVDVVLELLDPLLDIIKGLIKPLGDVLGKVQPFVEVVVDLIKKAVEPLQDKLDDMAPFLEEVLGGALEFVSGLLTEVLIPAFSGVLDFLNGNFLGGIDGFGSAFMGIFSNVLSTIDSMFGTHLSEWYDGFNGFFMEVGSRLYEMNHQGEIEMIELGTKYSDMQGELYAAVKSAVYSGKSAEEAVEEAKKAVLDTSEKLYFFDQKASDWNLLGIAQDYYAGKDIDPRTKVRNSSWYGEYYKNGGGVPKLASGGVAYGDTLALIGDNPDARVNPEVVAPLSELSAINAKALDKAAEKIAALIGAQLQKQPISIEIVTRLSDDTELTRSIIRNINECTRQDGVCVIKGI